jgi:predicted Rossmann fold nucleotide-binding protein DprA/Smf involved in DNA uptake
MARNRYIYALADYALVVQSDLNKGGTWTGAAENLRAGWIPLFVRNDTEAPGNQALIRQGGISFQYQVGLGESLRAYLTRIPSRQESQEPLLPPVESATVREEEPAYAATAASTPTEVLPQRPERELAVPELDLYGEFLRRLKVLLEGGAKTEKEIARALELEPAQAKAWLKRAEKSGEATLQGKPKKYELPQRGLF